MNHKRLVTVAVVLIAVLALAGPAWADLRVGEMPLSQNGWAYEANLDSQGKLWVSDLDAGEIWSFNTSNGAHTAYQVGGQPSDAHGDGAGSVWWADFDSNRLSRLSTSANQATVWEIPDSSSLYSSAIDSSGNVWVSDYDLSFLYRLDPNTNRFCTFTLPDAGLSEYLAVAGQALWFGDLVNARIVRLQNDIFDWWNLPGGSYPLDLELDDTGRVWWTDHKKGYLGRLDSTAATITTFTPPASGKPIMLTLFSDKVWYSQQNPDAVVVLDPAVAASQTQPVTTGTQTTTPSCRGLPPLKPIAVTAIGGQTSWSGQTYATALDTAGWVIYGMPQGSTPWGISAADQVWLVDQTRQVLANLSLPYTIDKQVSVDGGATWLAADAVTGPELLPGFNPQFRVVGSNTGNVAITLDVSDPDLPALDITGVTLAVGATDVVVSGPVTGAWAKGQHTNTVTVNGANSGNGSYTWIDNANYLGADPSYTIEKQVSADGGTTWWNADAITGPELLQGNAPKFRVLGSNTGNVAITLDVSDPGLPGLTVNDVSLAVGATNVVVAGPVTGTWAEGQQTNTATVDGSYIDDSGHEWTDSQHDDANYFGAHGVYLPLIVRS